MLIPSRGGEGRGEGEEYKKFYSYTNQTARVIIAYHVLHNTRRVMSAHFFFVLVRQRPYSLLAIAAARKCNIHT